MARTLVPVLTEDIYYLPMFSIISEMEGMKLYKKNRVVVSIVLAKDSEDEHFAIIANDVDYETVDLCAFGVNDAKEQFTLVAHNAVSDSRW